MRKIQTQPNFGRRIAATLIDYCIVYGFTFWYIFEFGQPDGEGGYEVTGLPALLPVLVWFVYFPVIESIKGQSFGHRLAGLMVIHKSGKKADFGQVLLRRLLDPIDLWFFGLVAILTIRNNDQHQRVGDLAANTIVIGGLSRYCSECRTELVLDPREVMKGRFECSECGHVNELSTINQPSG